ncbi:hypothetical protein [Leifsonia sp. EB34]|uniref:hypothetical protein n=1 Tax=Leifsonia sp. EB34 TaxID=3156303 RepID=UPI0035124082
MAIVALVALATTPGAELSTVRLVDALVVLLAAAMCAFCAGVAEVRRGRPDTAAADPAAKAQAPS